MSKPPVTRRTAWNRAHRIIASRYPPIALFERIADPSDWDALIEIEALTNPRIRDAVGEIALVPPKERISGPGASWVMAAFTHLGRPSRFTDGTFGVYYAARNLACAVAETTFHFGKFYRSTAEPACDVDMRVLVGAVKGAFHDIRNHRRRYRKVYAKDDYTASQAFGRELRAIGTNGITYDSVRLDGGHCVAAFRPRLVSPPDGTAQLLYHWDGDRIARYFDYAKDEWRTLARAG